MTSPAEHLVLRPFTLEDEQAARAAHRAMASEDFSFLLEQTEGDSWSQYLDTLGRVRRGVGLAPGRVPATFLVAEVGGCIVGRTSIRHELNDWLLARGGHIGYGVLPGARRRGYATEILRQSLVIARSYGVREALLTVDDDNVGSIAVVEAAGGRRDPAWPGDELDGRPIGRYWIPLP
ncbi:GNAT family N-acetyltransferase [uncultured Jatrophihabitans sp.]|uniref:GNAT family N-acetyltransferase n=1 Tax=uncultured Jatrophihabitans sp. TaxID=1610747 RepID=UPI0035CC1F46